MRRPITFPSKGLLCRGWLYTPDELGAGQRAPAIVMAHGFSAVKEMYLPPFAERFATAGFAVLVFDFRHLGESDGQPRGQIFPQEQQEDYRNAISWVCRQPQVDPERVGVWGTSYSGGHVLHLGAFDRRIKAVVAQVPAVSIWRQFLHLVGLEGVRGFQDLVLHDRLARFDTAAVNVLPVVAPPDTPSILGMPDAYEWFTQTARMAPTWINQVTVESVERLLEYDAAGAIELIAPTPLLMILAELDAVIPIAVARAAFERAGQPKELLTLGCGHFDVYHVEPWHRRAAEAAVRWFGQHLG